jgi:hypothetical protein
MSERHARIAVKQRFGRSGVLTVFAIAMCGATAHAGELRVLHAEPFTVQLPERIGARSQKMNAPAVSVAGKQFDLALESNERLAEAIPASQLAGLGTHALYRGQLSGIPGSWVRLSRINGRTYGAIWDGIDLYAIGPRHEIEAKMDRPIAGGPSETAIFRWADTQGGEVQACGLADDTRATSADQYRALVRELKDTAAATASQQVEVALIGDYEFYTAFGSQAVATMLERINVVDGIFSSQVGVSIVPTDFKVFDTASDPFDSTSASTLLDEVGAYKASQPAIRSRGIAHLMTGRNLDGNTVGIAVMSAVCQPRAGVSLSQGNGGSFTAPLIAAHELGHNFGAPHDGEGECQSAPSGFLMAPSINGSSQFSNCSIQQMQPVIASAACITAYQAPDASVSFPGAPFQVANGESFDVPIDIGAPGDGAVQDLTVTANIGGSIESATLDGTTCTIDRSTVQCRISQLASHETRRLTVRTHLLNQQPATLSASVSAWKDANDQNNSATTSLVASDTASPPPAPAPSPAPTPSPSQPPPASGKKSGGGGGMEVLSLLGLLLTYAVRRHVTSR